MIEKIKKILNKTANPEKAKRVKLWHFLVFCLWLSLNAFFIGYVFCLL